MSLEKHMVATGFSQAASTYNRWAEAQERIARRLARMVPPKPERSRIVDLGCGTGLLTEELFRQFPDAEIHGVDLAKGMISLCRERWDGEKNLFFHQSDIECYSIPSGTDLVASSSTFQWLGDPISLIQRLSGSLESGGLFASAVFVEGTLEDFFACADRCFADRLPRLDYPAPAAWQAQIEAAGFSTLMTTQEPVTVWYDHPMDILRTFKGIGATFRHQEGYSARSAAEIRRFLEEYTARHGNNESLLPMTYQVQFTIAEA